MIKIDDPKDLEEIAAFIAGLNNDKKHHVAYCGTKKEEVLHTLQDDFSDLPLEKSIVAAYENNQLVGVLGLDIDASSNEGELWGPFVVHSDWQKVALLMWHHLLAQLAPFSLKTVFGFHNVHNKECDTFFLSLGGERENREDTILRITRNDIDSVEKNSTIIEYQDDFAEAFKKLHQDAFPNAYYSSDEIVSRLSEYNKLFLVVVQERLVGYAYCEINTAFSEGDIHFIAVEKKARNKGVGKSLVKECLAFMYSYEEINEITLCVNSNNHSAIKIYRSAGFKEFYHVASYELSFPGDTNI
ncbi:GNAT family N-acetyltransferase [Evansella cellulosilytica]|uniref:GCN5-related N-acetyltransferase n=1 Tax=Evansella cellulosilytica (strain ATCC 21833 / DSM 2522 / FERM P-1141 / JCM 9156 / N-4) TaxID=649639 RepID=E6TYH9_EVAC2|nr:N-acetyltransferase [Evansella cellulosilytica]ADU28917.1 GCN5-related N-acetyltransferase [Evansella cellulosilytica DSM 2522]